MSATSATVGKRDYSYAFAATVGFMLIWGATPLGDLLTGLMTAIDARLADWAWPLAGLAFFWLCRLGVFLIRRRLNGR